jgi:hypothetical protein
MTNDTEIRWEMGKYAIERGTVGVVELFSLSASTTRGDTQWTLASELPGIRRYHIVESSAEGKEKATQLLTTWLHMTGLTS